MKSKHRMVICRAVTMHFCSHSQFSASSTSFCWLCGHARGRTRRRTVLVSFKVHYSSSQFAIFYASFISSTSTSAAPFTMHSSSSLVVSTISFFRSSAVFFSAYPLGSSSLVHSSVEWAISARAHGRHGALSLALAWFIWA